MPFTKSVLQSAASAAALLMTAALAQSVASAESASPRDAPYFDPRYETKTPIKNVDEWSKRFRQAAADTNVDAMAGILEEAGDPRLPTKKVKDALRGFLSIAAAGGNNSIYSEQVNVEKLGTVFQRILIAVMYKSSRCFTDFH